MTYIENVFLCLAIPLILSLFFTEGRGRRFTLFMTLGMGICLLSAYVSSFFMVYYGTSATVTAIEITPVCEEVMKLLPLLFFFLIFEPEAKELPGVAISIAVGFATFENVCYLTQNGAGQFVYLLIRGFGTGAMHIVCGSVYGRVLRPVWGSRPLRAACLFGLLCVAIIYHAIYNLLVSVGGTAQLIAYAIPLLTALCFCLLGQQTAAQKQ